MSHSSGASDSGDLPSAKDPACGHSRISSPVDLGDSAVEEPAYSLAGPDLFFSSLTHKGHAPPTSNGEGGSPAAKKVVPRLLNEAEERCFVCEVCSKTFKRETNLMFHMATHRQHEPGSDQQCWNAPVQCSACPRVFGTKYQARKHFLRRHYDGERRFACTRCNLKAFAVKEDLTTHVKTCGRTYACTCGVRPRSLAALEKHCKQFKHTPSSPLQLSATLPGPAEEVTSRPAPMESAGALPPVEAAAGESVSDIMFQMPHELAAVASAAPEAADSSLEADPTESFLADLSEAALDAFAVDVTSDEQMLGALLGFLSQEIAVGV